MEKKTFAIVGMECAGCATNVERKLNSLNGVKTAAVNFAAHTALVEYDKNIISPLQMKNEIIEIGYDLITDDNTSVTKIEEKAYSKLRHKVIVSWIFALITLCLSMGWINVGSKNVEKSDDDDDIIVQPNILRKTVLY